MLIQIYTGIGIVIGIWIGKNWAQYYAQDYRVFFVIPSVVY